MITRKPVSTSAHREPLRLARETVRTLRVRTGVRTGDTGGLSLTQADGGGLGTTQAAALFIGRSGPTR